MYFRFSWSHWFVYPNVPQFSIKCYSSNRLQEWFASQGRRNLVRQMPKFYNWNIQMVWIICGWMRIFIHSISHYLRYWNLHKMWILQSLWNVPGIIKWGNVPRTNNIGPIYQVMFKILYEVMINVMLQQQLFCRQQQSWKISDLLATLCAIIKSGKSDYVKKDNYDFI